MNTLFEILSRTADLVAPVILFVILLLLVTVIPAVVFFTDAPLLFRGILGAVYLWCCIAGIHSTITVLKNKNDK